MQGHYKKAYEFHHKALATLLEKFGENAADKTPMYEMPLTDFCVWGFGVGESIFCIGVLGVGVLSLAFCPEIK